MSLSKEWHYHGPTSSSEEGRIWIGFVLITQAMQCNQCNVILGFQAEPLGVTLLSLPNNADPHMKLYQWCLSVFMQVSAGSPDRNYASPSSSPSQLSSFQPFMSISSSSLVKDELLTGVEHTMVSMCPWHSLAQSQWRFLSAHPNVRVTDKAMKEKQRDVADLRANPSFTPHCCLPCRHV